MIPSVPQQGIIAALWTPTDSDNRIIKHALAEHLVWLRARGIHGVLALGSTGEFPRFEVEQRKALLEMVAELAAPLTVIANITDIRPWAVAELGDFARRLGLPAVTVMPPGFFPLSQADLLAYFLHAADAAQLPVFLYNFPDLTGTRIGMETVAAFADRAAMAGIKHSGVEFSYHQPLIQLGREKDFVVFSGADTRLPEVLKLGAGGCIGGLVNFIPDLMVEVFKLCRPESKGDVAGPAGRLAEVGAIIDQMNFPLNVAAAMEARGLIPGAPKSVVSQESARLYRRIVDDLRALFESWGLEPAGPVVPSTVFGSERSPVGADGSLPLPSIDAGSEASEAS